MACIVYELANPDLREVFVATTTEDLGSELSRNRNAPPAAIAHWPLEYRRSLRVLDGFLDPDEAERHLREYRPPEGYRLVSRFFAAADSSNQRGASR